ncbi:hypothetical protein [Pseudomonas aeruginosa]|uniref:hypothetical protein n=1 Tax=Pseudomonas aeruginosa TaxID=287 RepID=UPI001E35977F|nr:hypothetical protein [Pseudomonas aeruginosa]
MAYRANVLIFALSRHNPFSAFVGGWIQVRRGVGGSEVLEVYQDLLAGRSAPQLGYILSLDGG